MADADGGNIVSVGRRKLRNLAAILTIGLAAIAEAGESATAVPMYDKGLSTYYVAGRIDGHGTAEFLVDTGSAYVILPESIVAALRTRGEARYLRELSATLADGSRTTAPVFLIRGIHIGSNCGIRDVEAVALPNTRRYVLGLSALRKAAPFTVSLDPPGLVLNRCETERAAAGAPHIAAVLR